MSRNPAREEARWQKAWVDRVVSIALVAALLAVSGCGFRPVHGGGKEDKWLEVLRGARLEVPENSVGWQLGRFLRGYQGIGGGTGEHDLVVAFSQRRQDLLVQRDSDVIRSSIRLVGNFVLLDSNDDEIVGGRVFVSAGYNRVEDGFANEVALRDAEVRAARELAGKIWRHLILVRAE